MLAQPHSSNRSWIATHPESSTVRLTPESNVRDDGMRRKRQWPSEQGDSGGDADAFQQLGVMADQDEKAASEGAFFVAWSSAFFLFSSSQSLLASPLRERQHQAIQQPKNSPSS